MIRPIIQALLLIALPMISLAEPRLRPDNWAHPVINSELGNLYQVDEGVFRSEQPDAKAFQDISGLGIKEVLNLREYHSDDDEAKGLPLKLHHIKIDTAAITEDQLVEALRYIQNSDGPILVHCWHGSDRTGAVIAAYRVIIQGWSRDAAIDELVNGGYGYHATFYPNVVALIQHLDEGKIRAAIGLR